MNLDIMRRLASTLPEGKKKDEMMRSIENIASQDKKKDGLYDEFDFTAKGKIKLEEIDEKGNVVGVLQEKDNLVVNGAEEILLRAFSGDTDRVLYKNRIPKALGGVTGKYHIGLAGNISEVIDGTSQLTVAPNIFWNAVRDEDFVVTYGYRPKTVFLKEEVTEQVGKKAFSISTVSVTGSIPLTAELYSSETNTFIGLGDGKYRTVDLADARIVKAGGFSVKAGKLEATTVNAKLTIEEKMTNLTFEYEKSNLGGQIEVSVDGVVKTTLEAYDSTATDPKVAVYEVLGLTDEVSHKLELKYTGSDASITGTPKVVITSLKTNGLTGSMNSLAHEFESFTKSFNTITSYNTTTVPPFVVQLEHFPVVKGTDTVKYGDTVFTRATSKETVAEGKYFIDEKTGILYFNRALTGLSITNDITGEIYELKSAALLTASKVTHTITNEPITGADGTKKDFDLANKVISAGTIVIKVNNATVTNYTLLNGKVTFATAPLNTDTIVASYSTTVDAVKYVPKGAIDTVKVNNFATGTALAKVTAANDFTDGKFMIDSTGALLISTKDADASVITNFEIIYTSPDLPGFATGYKRAIILKEKVGAAYPWYQLDKGTVSFIADFNEKVPGYNVTIREMGLFDGPRKDDKVDGFTGFPVDAFSLVTVGDTRKETTTGIRVTWTIKLINKDGNAFYAGY